MPNTSRSKQLALTIALCSLALVVLGSINVRPMVLPQHAAPQAIERPNVGLSRTLGHWPDAEDLARLQSTDGQPPNVVLRIMGHPKAVIHQNQNSSTWEYDWQAYCSVTFRDGKVNSVFYTSGY